MDRNTFGSVFRSTLILLLLSACNMPRPTVESQPSKDPKPADTRSVVTSESLLEDQKELPSQEPFWIIAIGGEGRDY